MRRRIDIYLVVAGLLLLAAPASALIPDDVTISTDTEWLTAGSSDTATIEVRIANSTPGSTWSEGATVEFAVDSTLGSITPAVTTTDATGMATAVFTPGTTSGDATITVTVLPEGEEMEDPLIGSIVQKIDHAAPSAISGLWYEPEVTAGGATDITVRMVDQHGNVVDDRNVAETVSFMVGSPEGGAAFGDDTDVVTVPVNAAGNATVTLRVDRVAGENIVLITFPDEIGSRYLTVNGLADGEPSKIYQRVSPKVENPDRYPEQPLDRQFTITYALYDEYGNPAGERQIIVNVRSVSGSLTPGEWLLKTNSQGKAQITYGPSDRAGVVEIVATAVDNSSVSCTQKVGFYSTTPTDMLLTAVPGTIASRDVKDDLVSLIRAKVMDSKGNPVRDETVSFRIISVENGTYPMTNEPLISNGTHTFGEICKSLVSTTDDDGYATIDFHPGAFTRDNDMASGTATIQAIWNDKRENTTVSFRNYPYLSVRTSVKPQSVAVNGSVNVTIQLVGDGWALQSRPIDVVLCTDRSGSMLKNTTSGGYNGWFYDANKHPSWVEQESIDDRMVHAMRAAKIFVSQMQPSKDRIGLVSFGQSGQTDLDNYGYKFWAGNDYNWVWHDGYWGWRGWHYDSSDDNAYIARHYKNPQYYGGPATRDLELTDNYQNVNVTIDKWLPCGGTPMREGLYRSVQMIRENPREKADPVKAIVLLTDGEWNTGGDPEGGQGATSFPGIGTGSVIDHAKDNGIKIFTIALGDEPRHDQLQRYADKTGGRFYSATAGDDLTQVYEDIAQKLQEAAGVNTTMDLAFDNVMINSTPTNDVFKYEPLDPVSTREVKYWTDNGSVFWGPKSYDQSSDWDDKILTFDVGDIYLNQTWETTFNLKVLKEGNIDIFGEGSVIRFNGTQGETELGLPHTYITARLELNETDITAADLWLDSLSVKTDGPGILVPSWNLTYTGNRSLIQKVMYQFSPDNIWWDGAWHEADTKHHPVGAVINSTYSSRLDFREKGGWYKIRISARENIPDGASDEITCMEPIQVETRNAAYIKIG